MGRVETRSGVPARRVAAMQARESARFEAAHARSAALRERATASMPRGVPMSWMESLYEYPPVFAGTGSGSRFRDVDGHEYVDMYLGDLSGFCGHAPPPVVEAVGRRMAAGNHFLLPGEDAVVVAEHLVVLEDGRLVPEQQGLPASVTGQARLVQFNDVPGLEAALAPRDVALVLTEPVMTNTGIVEPVPGFHAALRELTRAAGTLLALDETHSLVGAYGGMAGELGLEADLLTVGKSIAAGVPLGAYGMTDEVAARSLPAGGHQLASGEAFAEIATGGTLFANALSMAAGRAALTEVLTPQAFVRACALGTRMVDGMRAAVAASALPWNVAEMGTHAYYGFAPVPARDGAEARANDDPDLRALMRLWLVNRGVWESGWWLGPTVSIAHDEADVDEYVARFGELLDELTRPAE